MTYDETAVDKAIDRLLTEHPHLDAADDGVLDDLDQFHIGGAGAVDRLIPALALAGGDRVLDVGSGFGGPARQIARRTAHHVVGIDLAPAYVEAARSLTAKAGLSDLVRFELGDIAAFRPDRRFEAAITMHVQMNVEDKTTWFGRIADHLAPGARLAVWEVCRPRPARLPWPMPWSLDGTDSFVIPPGALLTAIEDAGFSHTEWTDESLWVRDWIAATFAGGPPAGPALPMLLEDGYTRVINFATALTDGTLEVWRGSFTKTT
ncbi:class I SAM-dependent methyltransferase [Actinomadura sp. DC4]|uniref:SAM-dependent methyltransferase n=1 Tax=Actinomadura sp. DC4 TaxID=3055069 RepID=UPI0025B1A2B8|nr:class I SAM-dependent methyltransferase [Actinomadura sp. DC4]MDN3356981.1 class I SAM-dependent methyltransferase [Actinomadura sp. DC4]